jgi:hypothetical protein
MIPAPPIPSNALATRLVFCSGHDILTLSTGNAAATKHLKPRDDRLLGRRIRITSSLSPALDTIKQLHA